VGKLVHLTNWLETQWVAPAYSGWLLLILAIFFFGAATNTLAGWLYVLSGVMMALLLIAAVLSTRTLKGLQIQRSPIEPVTVGDVLTIEVVLTNSTAQPKQLLEIHDLLPHVLGQPTRTVIDTIQAGREFHWVYHQPTQRRGVFGWQTLQLRTAAPLGLFWCQRFQTAKATAIVYPTVLPLICCPLLDELDQVSSPQFFSRDHRSHPSAEGLTRSLRPYRWGDSTRLIHWRTSARFGELQVRELEILKGGQEVIICLDSASSWQDDIFEQAVIATASLYFYACRQGLNTQVWTARTGLLKGDYSVLEALAAVYSDEPLAASPPRSPLVWLSQTAANLNILPTGSRWILWSIGLSGERFFAANAPGLSINPEQPLQSQLQRSLESV
jgi:uncharacterized protein (DUF58 family)